MRTKTRTGTRFKPMRIVWRDSAAKRRNNASKKDTGIKTNSGNKVKESLRPPFSLY